MGRVSGKKKEETAPKRRPSGPSGPSGVNRNPRYTLRATYEEFNRWQKAADKADQHLNQWIRDACNAAESKKRR